MAGKAPVFANTRLAYAIDHLSKNALIDLVVDLAMKEIGEEAAWTDERIAETIQGWLSPITTQRKDKPVSLAGHLKKFDYYADLQRKRQEQNK